MGEWKRIYGNPKRLLAIGLITLLSVVFFFAGRMDYFGRGAITALLDGEGYYAGLVERLRGHTDEEIARLLEEEYNIVQNYWTLYGRNRDDPWITEWVTEWGIDIDAVYEAIAQRPYFDSMDELDPWTAGRRLSIALSRVGELEEQAAYISGYAAYLDRIQTQAERQSQTALFGDGNSFAHRNLVHTADEFDALRGVEVSFGANRAYEGWIEYELADYLYLLLIVIFVFAFLEERKAGLWGTVRACRGGRLHLGVQRAAILASASVLGVALIYGVNLLVSLTLSGGWGDMGRSIQSLLMFRTLTQQATIGQWITRYLLVKAASGFMVGLFLWCVLGSMSNVQYSLAVLGVTVAVEYVLFAFLPVQSILNPVKYFNLFSYIRTSKLYTEYLNVNLLGWPFGIRPLALIWLPIFTAAFFVWAMLIQHLRRPEGNRDILSVIAGVWDRFMDFFRRRLTIGGWELYKTLIFQRVLLILIVIFIASGSLSYIRYSGGSAQDPWYQAYLKEMMGPIDGWTDEYLETARVNASGDPELLSALGRVEARVEELRTRAAAGGYQPWIVESRPYESVYGDASQDLQRVNAAAAMMFLIMCCAASGAFERQSGVVFMIRSLKRGRRGIFVRKLLTAAVLTALVCAMVYAREFDQFVTYWKPASLAAPVGNFDILARFPLNVTMGQYITLVYALRFLMLYLLAVAVMFVSSLTPTVELAYIVNITALGLPAILFALGIDILRYVSPIQAVSAAEGLWTLATTGSLAGLIPFAVWLIVGGAALALYYRRWTGARGRGAAGRVESSKI